MNIKILIIISILLLLLIFFFILNNIKNTNSFENNYNNNFESKDDIIKLYPNFLTSDECDKIIELSKNKLKISKINGNTEIILNKTTRDSYTAWVNDDEDPIIKKISLFVSEISGKPIINQERLQIVKYEKNGFYKAHYDACNYKIKKCEYENKKGGPRYITFLIYLNDDFKGGGTWFPKLNFTTVPKKGDAILFYDTDYDGNIITNSLHQANDIIEGEKWVCNKWVRHFPYI